MAVESKQSGDGESLFPDLAPYGQAKPLPELPVKKVESEPKKPEFIRQPNITERPLNVGVESSEPESEPEVVQMADNYELPPEPKEENAPAPDDTIPVEPVAQEPTKRPRKLHFKFGLKSITLGAAILAVVLIVLVLLTKRGESKKTDNQVAGSSTSSSSASTTTIAVYYPKNLPKGFSYDNNLQTLKTDVYFYSILGQGQEQFYITQQQIPSEFDFNAFTKKFLEQDKFSSTAGDVLAGKVGDSYIASIRTKKNTWIIINSSPQSKLSSIETIARSLDL